MFYYIIFWNRIPLEKELHFLILFRFELTFCNIFLVSTSSHEQSIMLCNTFMDLIHCLIFYVITLFFSFKSSLKKVSHFVILFGFKSPIKKHYVVQYFLGSTPPMKKNITLCNTVLAWIHCLIFYVITLFFGFEKISRN